MALIASDLNNPEFAGATNPDSRLAVQFYPHRIKNEFESERQGRPVWADVDFVKIFVPGDPTTVIDTPVREEHKKRFPLHWAHYQNSHGGDTKEIGTPLADWPRLSVAQVEELRALKFYTVEAVANASDAALQRIGMVAGMSPYAFRDHAIRFLKLAQDDSIAQQKDKENAELREQIRQMQEGMEEFKAALEARARSESVEKAPKKGAKEVAQE